MLKRLTYFQFLLMLLASCEEYYTPKIDDVSGHLVVDALITNDLSKNYVHLSTTQVFYDEQAPSFTYADVQLVDKNGVFFDAIENNPGSFTFKNVPEIGNSYKLLISYQNFAYESEMVTMPPLPKILNAYSGDKAKQFYKYNDWNNGVKTSNFEGHNIYIDLPVTDSLAYYRFSTRSVLEWYYIFHNGEGWVSIYENNNFNIASLKTFTQADTIKKHPLTWLSYDRNYYILNNILSDDLAPHAWLIIVDQFGTSKESYEFHDKLNSQFAADGSIFDRIPGQIDGNIKCISDPSKKVYGFFDLNSYRQFRYNIRFQSNQVVQAFIYPDIPDYGTYGPGFPDWWYWY